MLETYHAAALTSKRRQVGRATTAPRCPPLTGGSLCHVAMEIPMAAAATSVWRRWRFISSRSHARALMARASGLALMKADEGVRVTNGNIASRSEEHTSELQSR